MIQCIEHFIPTEKENAITARTLADLMTLSTRDVMQAIQDRRRAGVAILANRGRDPGFYLSSDPDEIRGWCRQLQHEESELRKTREAVQQAGGIALE